MHKVIRHAVEKTRTCDYIEHGIRCGKTFIDRSGRSKFCDPHKAQSRLDKRKAHNDAMKIAPLAFAQKVSTKQRRYVVHENGRRDYAQIPRSKPKSLKTVEIAMCGKPPDSEPVESASSRAIAVRIARERRGCKVCILTLRNYHDASTPRIMFLISKSENRINIERKSFGDVVIDSQIQERMDFLCPVKPRRK